MKSVVVPTHLGRRGNPIVLAHKHRETILAGDRNLVYGLIDLVEESLEMLGATLFFCALLGYMCGDDEVCYINTDGSQAA